METLKAILEIANAGIDVVIAILLILLLKELKRR